MRPDEPVRANTSLLLLVEDLANRVERLNQDFAQLQIKGVDHVHLDRLHEALEQTVHLAEVLRGREQLDRSSEQKAEASDRSGLRVGEAGGELVGDGGDDQLLVRGRHAVPAEESERLRQILHQNLVAL